MYLDVINETKTGDLDPGERYLAATRLSMPPPPRRVEERSRGMSVADLRDQLRIGLTRPEPQRIPGFPTSWEMAVALTPQRLVVWNVGGVKGSAADRPGDVLGTVRVADIASAELTTLPDRKGRTLAVKVVLRHGPRVMLDVVAGFRPDSESFVEELTRLVAPEQSGGVHHLR